MNINIDDLQSEVSKDKEDIKKLENEKSKVVAKLDHYVVQMKKLDNVCKTKILQKMK